MIVLYKIHHLSIYCISNTYQCV